MSTVRPLGPVVLSRRSAPRAGAIRGIVPAPRLVRGALACLAAALCLGCPATKEDPPRSGSTTRGPSPLGALAPSAAPAPESAAEEATPRADELPVNAAPTDADTPENARRFALGELTDIGPAAPARASADGIYVATKHGELLFARRRGNGFDSFDAPAEDFSRYGRAPSLSPTHAYWVSPSGSLLRADRKRLAVEELDRGAHSGTRTAVVTLEGRDLVAYVKDDGGEAPRAYLYGGPGHLVRLSEDAATATSVTAVVLGKKAHVFSLEGRIGLSSIHRRTVEWQKGKLRVTPDDVPWVGAGSHSLTEVGSLGSKSPFAFLAMSRDASHFGLVQLPLDEAGGLEGEPFWLPYPNGIDPAPVAADVLCGAAHFVYARPSSPKPRSPQELRITAYDRKQEELGEVLATSRAFNDVSVAARPGGAVLSWTADRRTWAMTIDCPK